MNFSEFCSNFRINELDFHWRTDDELQELCRRIHTNLLIINQNTQTFYVYNNGYNFYICIHFNNNHFRCNKLLNPAIEYSSYQFTQLL